MVAWVAAYSVGWVMGSYDGDCGGEAVGSRKRGAMDRGTLVSLVS